LVGIPEGEFCHFNYARHSSRLLFLILV